MTPRLYWTACTSLLLLFTNLAAQEQGERLPTGKYINPSGKVADVASFPGHMVVSPNGQFIAVSNFGFREQLSILDGESGKLLSKIEFNGSHGETKEQMYFGLAFAGNDKLYVSRGGEDKISVVDIDEKGQATLAKDEIVVPQLDKAGPNFIAGLAVSADGHTLYAVGNETYFHLSGGKLTGGQGRLFTIDLGSGKVVRSAPAGGFPFDAVAPESGPGKGRVYVSAERDDEVLCFDGNTGKPRAKIRVGRNPSYLRLSPDERHLYVSNSSSDSLTDIDLASNDVRRTISLRPEAQGNLPGATPLGMCIDLAGKRIYVALADLNAVAVVDATVGKVVGFITTGWYPTGVARAKDQLGLFVTNAKGNSPRVPNGSLPRGLAGYDENIIEGTLTRIGLDDSLQGLPQISREAMRNNNFGAGLNASFTNPRPKHVIYIVKENRTYDQVFGDIKKGNGDPSICMFPEEVTPNEHALADRFVLLDNFYCTAEVSADGWSWSTGGMANDYDERNVPFNYSDRGRGYDFEGQANDLPVDYYGVPDITAPPGGYIWDSAAKAGISYRNYGFFVSSNDDSSEFQWKSRPTKKALAEKTDPDYREFDTAYADSDAWVKLNSPAPKQMTSFGKNGAPSRYSEWKGEFDAFVKNGNLPSFTMLRLMRDHTAGTAPGNSSPRAMVADNDYAVGEVVDAVSHSPYWKDTVICIVEDDAQSGHDHVDCHRSTALLISPYTRKSFVDHRFWNTDSMLKTIEVMLGMKSMCQYDAFASPIDVFSARRENTEPYNAIMPGADILKEVNTAQSYRAADSARLLNRLQEETGPDLQLNDILWGEYERIKSKSGRRQR